MQPLIQRIDPHRGFEKLSQLDSIVLQKIPNFYSNEKCHKSAFNIFHFVRNLTKMLDAVDAISLCGYDVTLPCKPQFYKWYKQPTVAMTTELS